MYESKNFCRCSRFAAVRGIKWVDHLLSSVSPSGMPKLLFAACRGGALASPSVMDIALSFSQLVDRDWSFCWDAASDCVGNVLVVVTFFVCGA